MKPDLRLYVITSGTGSRTVEAAAQAARSGAGVVQVRTKEVEDRAALELVAAVAHAVADTGAPTRVLVDDRLDVALVARRRGLSVHGVHLGQDDLPAPEARELLGADATIGLTTGTLDLVRAARALAGCLDYLGAGPCRTTPTKDSGRPPLGHDGYRALVAESLLPVVAVGDIGPADIAPLRRAGVAGCAVVRAVMTAPDPGAAAADLLARWEAAGPSPQRPG